MFEVEEEEGANEGRPGGACIARRGEGEGEEKARLQEKERKETEISMLLWLTREEVMASGRKERDGWTDGTSSSSKGRKESSCSLSLCPPLLRPSYQSYFATLYRQRDELTFPAFEVSLDEMEGGELTD